MNAKDYVAYLTSDHSNHYVCDDCGANTRKLWKEQNSEYKSYLRCAPCSAKSVGEKIPTNLRQSGHISYDDCIGHLIPAIPRETRETVNPSKHPIKREEIMFFWSFFETCDDVNCHFIYSTIVKNGVEWWRKFPT